jgi:DNA modification methylase
MGMELLTGDCMEILPTLPAQSVQCCVTSPPYWGLRDYGTATWEGGDLGCNHVQDEETLERQFSAASTLLGTTTRQKEAAKSRYQCKCGARRIDAQIGLEPTPEEYVSKMVAVFREVWRVLRDDGTLWVNLGDRYASDTKGSGGASDKQLSNSGSLYETRKLNHGLKPKDLCGIPWRVAFALQSDGWYLRSDIIWHKPNPMPESVTDRPTKSHEYIFLLTKSAKYYYDADAIKEPADFGSLILPNCQGRSDRKAQSTNTWRSTGTARESVERGGDYSGQYRINNGRNKRTVWTIATQPYKEAHFATFPEELPKLCILAGSRPGDTVLDPFGGSGTTGKVALELGRKAVLIELNPKYCEMAKGRTNVTPGML